jgi:transposase InsO family protein
VAFVVDCYSRAIVGWHAATVKDTALVSAALKMALWRRPPRSRVEALGGQMTISSQPGRGTSLAVKIPLEAA